MLSVSFVHDITQLESKHFSGERRRDTVPCQVQIVVLTQREICYGRHRRATRRNFEPCPFDEKRAGRL